MKAINLIPPEAAIRSAARRRRFGIVMLAVMYVGPAGHWLHALSGPGGRT